MHDLTLVGVHDDGEHLVLGGHDGRRYRLRVDEPLRAAVRRDRARLGQLQIEMDGKLRPRDIQARIRAGHTAEEVAAEGGIPLEYVRRYEGPVLAEREFMAGQARACPSAARRAQPVPHARRTGGRAARRAGGQCRDDRLGRLAGEDGTWIVAVSFAGEGGRGRPAGPSTPGT